MVSPDVAEGGIVSKEETKLTPQLLHEMDAEDIEELRCRIDELRHRNADLDKAVRELLKEEGLFKTAWEMYKKSRYDASDNAQIAGEDVIRIAIEDVDSAIAAVREFHKEESK